MKKIIFIHLLNDFSGSPKVLSQIVKICNDNNQELSIHGGLTNLVGSTISNKTQVVISLEKMNRIIEVDESAKTITCESGVIIEDIINTVKDKVFKKTGINLELEIQIIGKK